MPQVGNQSAHANQNVASPTITQHKQQAKQGEYQKQQRIKMLKRALAQTDAQIARMQKARDSLAAQLQQLEGLVIPSVGGV